MQLSTELYLKNIEIINDPYLIGSSSKLIALSILNNKKLDEYQQIEQSLNFVPIKLAKQFAIWCGWQALSYIKEPDSRSVEGLKAAELYIEGKISKDEMSKAVGAANATAYAAYAAYAAYYAANATVYYAANAAYAAYAAANAAYADKERKKQIEHLKEMINAS